MRTNFTSKTLAQAAALSGPHDSSHSLALPYARHEPLTSLDLVGSLRVLRSGVVMGPDAQGEYLYWQWLRVRDSCELTAGPKDALHFRIWV